MTIHTILLRRSKDGAREIDWEAVYKEQVPRVTIFDIAWAMTRWLKI
jgi:hypothetical protein